MRTLLRTILSVALLLGSGVVDWAPVQGPAHASCCCGTSSGAEDNCPCPKPEGNRGPAQSLCQNRVVAVALAATRRTQGERRAESRPEPTTWAQALVSHELAGPTTQDRGRDPDLGRHLARLNTFRI